MCLLAASSTTGPDHQAAEKDPSRTSNKCPSSWSIEEVMQFVRDADPQALGPHAELFRKHVRWFSWFLFFFFFFELRHACIAFSEQGLYVLYYIVDIIKNWLFSTGDWWQGLDAFTKRYDHEVHGAEIGSCSQTLPSHWETQTGEIVSGTQRIH